MRLTLIGGKDESRVAKAAASKVHRVTTVDDKKKETPHNTAVQVEKKIKKKKFEWEKRRRF